MLGLGARAASQGKQVHVSYMPTSASSCFLMRLNGSRPPSALALALSEMNTFSTSSMNTTEGASARAALNTCARARPPCQHSVLLQLVGRCQSLCECKPPAAIQQASVPTNVLAIALFCAVNRSPFRMSRCDRMRHALMCTHNTCCEG